MTEAKVPQIQGLYPPDAEGCHYATLLAFVELSRFRQQKGRRKPHKNPTSTKNKYCRDCGEPHETGSLIWYECPFDGRWHTSMDLCTHPTLKENKK